MLNHIITPLDGSQLAECALPHVIAIASAFRSQITFLRVADETQHQLGGYPIDPVQWQIDKREARAYLDSIVNRYQNTGLQIQAELLEGHAADRIFEYALDKNADLLILSNHGRSGLSGWSISSVAQKIILRPACSVMIVRANQPVTACVDDVRYSRVLIPLDGSLRAEIVLPVATTIAQHYNAHLLALLVVGPNEMPHRTPLSEEDASLANRVGERNVEEGNSYLEQLRSRVPVDVETRLVQCGSASATINEVAEHESIDLVILSAHGYTGNTTWPYGSVATSYIIYGSTPVLIVQDARQEIGSPGQEVQTRRPEGRPDAQI
jgi:nucleotide-binding universal stress UspA family protein